MTSGNGRRTPIDPSDLRLEGLSDLVFGLALSIGAVFLIGSPPATAADLVGDVAEFGFSFLVLISVWMRYTRTMAVLRLEAKWGLRLNMILLFLVAIEPFLFNVAFTRATASGTTGFANLVTAVYGLNLGGLNACLGALSLVASRQLREGAPGGPAERFGRQAQNLSLAAAFFFVSALPWFYGWTLPGTDFSVRYLLWVAPLVLGRAWDRLA